MVVFNQALVTSVASQCFLYCGNQRMCPQVQPTLILLAVVEKGYSRRHQSPSKICHFHVLL